jgi:hypothetical protein
MTPWENLVVALAAGLAAFLAIAQLARRWLARTVQDIVDVSVAGVITRQAESERRQGQHLDRQDQRLERIEAKLDRRRGRPLA